MCWLQHAVGSVFMGVMVTLIFQESQDHGEMLHRWHLTVTSSHPTPLNGLTAAGSVGSQGRMGSVAA